MPLNITNHHVAISQYPRPGTFPTQFPDSDKPRLKYIKIMGYSLRTIRFRYTIWLEFNSKTFKRSKFKHTQREIEIDWQFRNVNVIYFQIGTDTMVKNYMTIPLIRKRI